MDSLIFNSLFVDFRARKPPGFWDVPGEKEFFVEFYEEYGEKETAEEWGIGISTAKAYYNDFKYGDGSHFMEICNNDGIMYAASIYKISPKIALNKFNKFRLGIEEPDPIPEDDSDDFEFKTIESELDELEFLNDWEQYGDRMTSEMYGLSVRAGAKKYFNFYKKFRLSSA